MIRKTLTDHQYLNRVASSRALYRLMVSHAVGVLAMPREGSAGCEWVVCGLTQKAMAKRLFQSPSMVREDLRRLIEHGWVKKTAGRRYEIGARYGLKYYLHADNAAFMETGHSGLVSRMVLGQILETERRGTTTGDMGASRKWQR